MKRLLPTPVSTTLMAVGMIAFCAPVAVAAQAVAPAQETVSPQADAEAAPAPKPATVIVTLKTDQGPIVLELEKERAPITTQNFLRYIDAKRFDGASIYRAVDMGRGYGLLQGGVKTVDKLFPPIAHEPTTKTGLTHNDGAISMARQAEGTARADFFITLGDMSGLDANPEGPGDNTGFAVFGHVVQGMDLVRKLVAGEIDPSKGGEFGMAGQMLAKPVAIISARRAPDWQPPVEPAPVPAAEPEPAAETQAQPSAS